MSSRLPEWNPKRPQVPVDKDGNWMSYPNWGYANWETIHQPFYAEFEIDGMRIGRSSKVVVLKDRATGKTYPMFVADLVKGIQQGDFDVTGGDGGTITGWWTASKRGANYGIRAVKI